MSKLPLELAMAIQPSSGLWSMSKVNICNFLVHLYCFILNSANEMMQMSSAAVPPHLHFISFMTLSFLHDIT